MNFKAVARWVDCDGKSGWHLVLCFYLCFEMYILLSFRNGRANKSSDDSIERYIVGYSSQEEGTCHHGEAGTWRSKSVGQETEEEGKCGPEPLLWFLQEGIGKAGQAGLGLVSWNNFSWLWGRGRGSAVPSCMVPGPRVTRAGGLENSI